MSAQIEEVVASAESLNAMADQLDALVSRFNLAGVATDRPAGATVVPRRRATDWQVDRVA
jgi:hypothetical protein